ncbi:MAG: hypothetical protein ACT4QA_19965 [Panacagrimonas sp.]
MLPRWLAGRQVVYPTEEDLSQRFLLFGPRTARYRQELQHDYPAFEREFNRVVARLSELEKQLSIQGDAANER